MFLLNFFCRHPHHQREEHALDEVRRLLVDAQRNLKDFLTMTDIKQLKSSVAEQAALISAAQAFVNSLEVTANEPPPAQDEGPSQADIDAVTADIEANNAALRTLTTSSGSAGTVTTPPVGSTGAPVPAPAPSPVTGSGDDSGATVAGTIGGVNDGTQNGVTDTFGTAGASGVSDTTGMQPGSGNPEGNNV